jgi:hypothetical protein
METPMNQQKGLRKYRRVYFDADNNVKGVIIVPGKDEGRLTVPILNLSAGGIFFTLKREEPFRFNKDDWATLNCLLGIEDLNFLINLQMRIVWVLDHAGLNNIGYGCKFENIPDTVRARIVTYVEDRYTDGTLRVD